MAVVSLVEFREETVVVHFGGESRSINAQTFGNSLVGFSELARAANFVINPGQGIEVRLEAYGPGSFRAIIRRLPDGIGGFFSRGAETVFWSVIATIIFDALVHHDPQVKINVTSTEVIVAVGNDKIIVPRNVYDAAKNAENNSDVQRALKRTFSPLQYDEKVTEFGLTPHMADPIPLVRIPRAEFPRIINSPVTFEEHPRERIKKETARLVILKAWLNHAKRKWLFEWNGVPISAPIAAPDFLDRLDRREHLIGAGDALDVEITFKQTFDPHLGVYVNDQNSFVITEVIKLVPKS